MQERKEKLWDYDAVEPGQAGRATTVNITTENICRYAVVAQNEDPRYQQSNGSVEFDGALVAMPTMVLSYAPLLREDIAENNGMVALEQSKTARRQTPFAKCEVRWHHPVRAGDVITGSRRVLEKYERRGSKFVIFRVEAQNQQGITVAEYDYTCIFEYAGGQRRKPQQSAVVPEQSVEPPAREPGQAPRFSKFREVTQGDRLASLSVSESQEIINRKDAFRLAGRHPTSNIHTDEEFARQNIFGGTVNAGPATMSYVDQMLELSFPLEAFYNGGRLLMRAITPFRAGDRVTFAGEVTEKRTEQGKQLVDCQVQGTNQQEEVVCYAEATLVMTE